MTVKLAILVVLTWSQLGPELDRAQVNVIHMHDLDHCYEVARLLDTQKGVKAFCITGEVNE